MRRNTTNIVPDFIHVAGTDQEEDVFHVHEQSNIYLHETEGKKLQRI